MRHALREAAVRLVLVAGGVLAGLVLLELALQAGAVWTARTGRRDPTALVAGRRRVLMLGDSNTYGLYVPGNDAYPRVLERLWNRVHPDDPIEVLNFAYPGMNSSRLRHLFPELVASVRPDLVLVMIGANDLWTVPEPVADSGTSASTSQLLWQYSRVYRLFFMLARAVAPPKLQLTGDLPADVAHDVGGRTGRGVFRYGAHTFEMAFEGLHGDARERGLRSDLGDNLRAMVEEARRDDVPLALLTYPAPNWVYRGVSGMIRDAAGLTGARLIELTPALAASCTDRPCAELFDDGHPTVAGHRQVAKYLAHALAHERLLAPRLTASRQR